MNKKNILTPEMQRCLDIIKEHGSIIRYPGGFWQKPNDELKGIFPAGLCGGNPEGGRYPLDAIVSNTITALEKRGLITPTDHRMGRNLPFPVKYELKKSDSNIPQPTEIDKVNQDFKKSLQASCSHPSYITGTPEGSYCSRCGKPWIG